MDEQQVTVTLPRDIFLRAERLARAQGTSLSGLVTGLLTEAVAQQDRYLEAQRHHLAWLAHAADLGTNGHITWTRDDLHER